MSVERVNSIKQFRVSHGLSSDAPTIDLIAEDGRIARATIVSKSGIKAIDDAVDAMLADLKIVPAPPQVSVIRIKLDVR